MVKEIVAPNLYTPNYNEVSVFLAGGIVGCEEWQRMVIEDLNRYDDVDNLVVYNPRRKFFDLNDLNATENQIEWEYKYLRDCDIFSMYFDNDQIQPICMYELGRHLRGNSINNVISVCENYPMRLDVMHQVRLASHGHFYVDMLATPKKHAERIHDAYLIARNRK